MQMLGVPSSNLSANQLGTLPTEVHERGPARGWHFLKTQVINHLKLLAYFQPILHCKVFGLWTSGFPWCPSVSRLCPNCVFLGRQHHRKVLPNILYIYIYIYIRYYGDSPSPSILVPKESPLCRLRLTFGNVMSWFWNVLHHPFFEVTEPVPTRNGPWDHGMISEVVLLGTLSGPVPVAQPSKGVTVRARAASFRQNSAC